AIPLGNTAGILGPLIDTRGAGGYVVAPPTQLTPAAAIAGGAQGDERCGAVVEDQAALVLPLPGWLVERLRPDPLPAATPAVVRLAAGAGRARGDRADRYLRAALDRTLATVLEAAPGTRNRTLFGAAVSLGRLVAGGALDDAETRAALITAATVIGLDDREATATVRSGLKTGAHHPAPSPPPPRPREPQRDPPPRPPPTQRTGRAR
ncbi:MAG: hypothetical protein HY830_24785, partial [Actinobacteria bacterium]|nr:hypothetical protein [Actinomycetota bacterium]